MKLSWLEDVLLAIFIPFKLFDAIALEHDKYQIDKQDSSISDEDREEPYSVWRTKSGETLVRQMTLSHIKNSILYITDVSGAVSNVGGREKANAWLDAFEKEMKNRGVGFEPAERW